MSLLSNMKTDAPLAETTDSVGGSGPVESGAYHQTVAMAYLAKSKGGAQSCVLHLKNEDGREVRQTLWVTGGDAKGNKHYYTKDGVNHPLPGFDMLNNLGLLTIGKEVHELETEDKVVNIYNFDSKQEVPTTVPVIVELLGQEIISGILKQTVDKNVKNDAGQYVPSGETRDENEVDKFFRARDKMTVAEIRGQATEAAFYETWVAKWTGETKNRAKGAAGGNNVTSGAFGAAAAKAGGTASPTKSLFT